MSQRPLFLVKCIYPRWQRTNLLARIGINLLIGSVLEGSSLALISPVYTSRMALLIYPWTPGCWFLAIAAIYCGISWCRSNKGREFFANS